VELAAYKKRIGEINCELGIPDAYGSEYGLSLQVEEINLIEVGKDIFGRTQLISSCIVANWQEMRESSKKDGINLLIVSAFRSVEYQANIIRNKLDKGSKISDILGVSAAPGYSEHHTGCALDLATSDIDAFRQSFEESEAFVWLQRNGVKHGFSLSYPKGTNSKIIYEPWHWACLQTIT